MVGIVIVSQNELIAREIQHLAHQSAPDVPMAIAYGNGEGSIGVEWKRVSKAVSEVYNKDGVLILFDLGSVCFNAESAIEFLDESIKEKIHVMDIVLIEGVITAAIESSLGKSIYEIKEIIKPMELGKMI